MRKTDSKEPAIPIVRPQQTPEGREKQIIAEAMNLAEQKILDGSANSQIICHFLKLGTAQAQYEMEKIKKENILLEAKAEAIKNGSNTDALYEEVINAIKGYRGEVEYDTGEEDIFY